ncbi:MAG TPA: PVC-type heme-binding CxxCH protein [Planctomycetota bacterium]|nr:PVC-type heme-binding CxxCH protein [Planctomycetota bacterium]
MKLRAISLFLSLSIASAASAQNLSPQEAVRRMKPADGFEVTLVASEPQIRQPLSISFDHRGRIWVIQYLQYPTPAGLKATKVDEYLRTTYDRLPEPPPRGPKGADKITILEDKDGDGFYETTKDFVTGLNICSGLCLGHGGAFVAQPPYLLFYPDRNGDDIPDGDPDVLLTGFGMDDTHSVANSLQWGPDGWLYGAAGSTSTSKIRGIEFQQGIWRYHPITKEFELFSEGGGNTWGLDFDRHGNAIAGTNFGGSAMLHQVQGAYYLKGFSKHGPLHNPNTYGYFEHVPYSGFKGGHVTCGGTIYQGGAFPAEYNDQYIACNVLSNDLYCHLLEPKGSSFVNRFGGDFLIGNDPWFRPIDTLIGPDGALYVVDWYDARANHVDPRDTWDKTNGRIYRVAWKNAPPRQRPLLAGMASVDLVDVLKHPNVWYRSEARSLLAERRDPGVIGTLKRSLPTATSAEPLWALYVSGGFDETLATDLLRHPIEDIRTWAIRLQGDTRRCGPAFRDALVSLARSEPSPRVRNQMACTAKRLPASASMPVIHELLARTEDAADPQIPMLLWWAIEDKAVSDRDLVLGLLASADDWKTPLTASTIVERLARRYMVEGDADACASLLAKAPGADVQQSLIRGMEKALEGRRLEKMPEPLREPVGALLRSRPHDPVLTCFAIRLGNEEAYQDALALLGTNVLRDGDAAAVIALLGQLARVDALPTLLPLLRSPSSVLRTAVLGALQAYRDPSVAAGVLDAVPGLTGALRSRALSLLTARPESSLALLQAVDRGALKPSDVPLPELQKVAAFNDPALNRLMEKHWGKVGSATPGEKQAQISSIRNILSKGKGGGNRARGKAIFTKTCAVCHTLWNEGNKIGPELTAADRKNIDLLALNIVDPSAMIRPEYVAHQILTSDGQVLTGLLVEQSAGAVTLLDANNARTVLSRARIQAMKPSALSLMPEKLLDPLTDPEILDFFAYLQGDGPVEIAAQEKAAPLKVCLVSGSLEYESDDSLAALQEHLEKTYNVRCTRAFRKTDEDLPGLENLETCDVMLLFTRRLKITGEQLDRVKKYCEAGKPIVAVRTASHAFQTWLDLDKEILGGSYSNHYGKGPEITTALAEKGKGHPILDGVGALKSAASLYKNPANAPDTETLLVGTAGEHSDPVAWVRERHGGRLFYTSLGDQADFKNDAFVRMIVNALFWTAKRSPEKKQGRLDLPPSDAHARADDHRTLPGTAPLEMNGDLAADMVSGIDRFLLKEIEASVLRRAGLWKRDPRSKEQYESSVTPNRERFRRMLGIVDERSADGVPEFPLPATEPGLGSSLASSEGFQARVIRWPVFRGVEGEGLFLIPKAADGPLAIVIPDADQTPEMLAGITKGLPEEQQTARRLAERGCWVLIPTIIDRDDTYSVSAAGKATNQPHREFVYRPAFEMGRTIIGYEIQKVSAFIDYVERQGRRASFKIGVFGSNEGGLLALYAAAADPRIDTAWVGGYFDTRQKAWEEPIYRNLFGLLREFGDAEIASLIAPRALILGSGPALEIKGPPPPRPGRTGAAPGFWANPDTASAQHEFDRYLHLTEGLPPADRIDAFDPGGLLRAQSPVERTSTLPDVHKRMKRQLDQLLEDTQVLLRRSEVVRNEAIWKKTDRRSLDAFERSTVPLRESFVDTVIGRFETAFLPPRPRSRQVYDEPRYRGYEVVLDVFPDVFAYGILLLPKDLQPGEQRPVVVCQHGLEGRPQDVADPAKNVPAYGQYACRLADQGFVVFAPQNPYIGQDKFRTLQRKANLLGKHLFSIIIPQHEVITQWLASQPFVDPHRIAFYGLSYGGKTAMRVPAAIPRYCLSICSADFNEWIWKNAALDSPYSYVTTGEYEMFEWNLGNTFNYAEMAALIAPRPFMVERGHGDGVAPDEKVAYEYAKVKRLYDELKIGDRTQIEVFDGPHKINGVGTFEFLHRHLQWPKPH